MTHLSLFTGIGGLDLAAEWAGFETVGQCEWADYPTKILEKHWPDVPRWQDIRSMTKESFYERTGLRTVDVISGGFPCQPFSVAGKRRGSEDDRYLWPEMLRVIEELRPAWVVGENVAGIVNMALDTVLSDLEAKGYAAGAFIIPACAVDAPHRRDRIAIVANTDSIGYKGAKRLSENTEKIVTGTTRAYRTIAQFPDGIDWIQRARESGFLRRNNGVPHRVDRLRSLGNAVVPQQFYPIFQAIAEVERNEQK